MSFFFFSSRRRHTRSLRDWSSDVCSSDLRHRLDERAGATPKRDRRAARRLQHPTGPPGGGREPPPAARALLAPAGRAVSRARKAAAEHRRLPLLLRADARPEANPVPDPESGPQEVRLPLRRLGHPRQVPRRARPRSPGRGSDRRLLRRCPLDPGGRGRAARNRPLGDRAGAASRGRTGPRCARRSLPPAQGHRAGRRGVRGARSRARRDQERAPRQGRTPARAGGHRRRPAQFRVVRALCDRGDGLRQAGRRLHPRRGRNAHGRDYGRVETLTALTAVLVVLLRLGLSSAFFRFYFDSTDLAHRVRVVRTSFWFTMASATLGLAAGWIAAQPIADALSLGHDQAWLVRAAFVGLWAQLNYEQLTSLFRVEERPVLFSIATIANLLITVAAAVVLVVRFHQRAMGVIVGNWIGTLSVYLVLLGYRRYQLGLQFDRSLFREMNRFGLPLVPSQLALWALAFSDRFFIAKFKGQA